MRYTADGYPVKSLGDGCELQDLPSPPEGYKAEGSTSSSVSYCPGPMVPWPQCLPANMHAVNQDNPTYSGSPMNNIVNSPNNINPMNPSNTMYPNIDVNPNSMQTLNPCSMNTINRNSLERDSKATSDSPDCRRFPGAQGIDQINYPVGTLGRIRNNVPHSQIMSRNNSATSSPKFDKNSNNSNQMNPQTSSRNHMSSTNQISSTNQMSSNSQMSSNNQLSCTNQKGSNNQLSSVNQISTSKQVSFSNQTANLASTANQMSSANPANQMISTNTLKRQGNLSNHGSLEKSMSKRCASAQTESECSNSPAPNQICEAKSDLGRCEGENLTESPDEGYEGEPAVV